MTAENPPLFPSNQQLENQFTVKNAWLNIELQEVPLNIGFQAAILKESKLGPEEEPIGSKIRNLVFSIMLRKKSGLLRLWY